jgi:GH24 family phage-related lysozyme (muramidase)
MIKIKTKFGDAEIFGALPGSDPSTPAPAPAPEPEFELKDSMAPPPLVPSSGALSGVEGAQNLIKAHEGLRLTAYRDPTGTWTIGYGHTSAAGGLQVGPGTQITKEQAEELFQQAYTKFAGNVSKRLTREASPNQMAAMVSLAYNIGIGAFSKSTVLKKFNAGDFAGAAAAFGRWTKSKGVTLKGLIVRRHAEAELFRSGSTPASKPLRHPLLGTNSAKTPDIKHVSRPLLDAVDGIQKRFGKAFDFRPTPNGQSVTVNVSGMSDSEKRAFVKNARQSGVPGIGVYGDFVHLRAGRTRAWGKDYTANSLPQWAKETLNG